MRAWFGYFRNVMFWILIQIILSTEANNQCPISANINEFRRSFDPLKNFLYEKDTITDVALLKARVLKQIQPLEQCCFLHNLGSFYVANIFPVLELTVVEHYRHLIHLANSVLSLTKELEKCHTALRCPCGQQSHALLKQFKEAYFKMSTTSAAVKAIGELNILFQWIENNFMA